MNAAGLTSTTEAYGRTEEWQAYQDAHRAGQLYCRVSFMPFGEIYEAMKAADIRSGFGDDGLSVGAVKFVADGSASERTMRMSTAFKGRPDDYGIPVAPASDYTPGPYEPMMAIQSMVTRKDPAGNVWAPSQRITVREAMQVCTMNGAYASFEENIKGSLTPGKLADVAVLAADPHTADPDTIKNIQVISTIMDGQITYSA